MPMNKSLALSLPVNKMYRHNPQKPYSNTPSLEILEEVSYHAFPQDHKTASAFSSNILDPSLGLDGKHMSPGRFRTENSSGTDIIFAPI